MQFYANLMVSDNNNIGVCKSKCKKEVNRSEMCEWTWITEECSPPLFQVKVALFAHMRRFVDSSSELSLRLYMQEQQSSRICGFCSIHHVAAAAAAAQLVTTVSTNHKWYVTILSAVILKHFLKNGEWRIRLTLTLQRPFAQDRHQVRANWLWTGEIPVTQWHEALHGLFQSRRHTQR